jgi:hypothetical protein
MIQDRHEPDSTNSFQVTNVKLILASHHLLTGKELLPHTSAGAVGQCLYNAPFVVLAHDTATDPVFFYANRQAQQLFEMTWQEMVALPSRLSAEPLTREERQRLLDRVSSQGYIDDYTGMRISKTGKRFLIENATVWNLISSEGHIVGQAAAFAHWSPIA